MQILGELIFLLAGPQADFALVSSDSEEPWTGGRCRGEAPCAQAHAPNAAFFFVCLCELALSEVEQHRQLRALPVLHLLPKTSSK